MSWWCHRLTICHTYYTYNFEIFHFIFYRYIQVKAHPSIKAYIRINTSSQSHLFGVDKRQSLLSNSWNMRFLSFLQMKCVENCEGWHQLPHLNIHNDWSRNVFRKKMKFQNVITSLFLIQFSSFLLQSVGKFLLFLLQLCKIWTGHVL